MAWYIQLTPQLKFGATSLDVLCVCAGEGNRTLAVLYVLP